MNLAISPLDLKVSFAEFLTTKQNEYSFNASGICLKWIWEDGHAELQLDIDHYAITEKQYDTFCDNFGSCIEAWGTHRPFIDWNDTAKKVLSIYAELEKISLKKVS